MTAAPGPLRSRLGAVVAAVVVLVGVFVAAPPARAVTIPRLLADTRAAGPGTVRVGFPVELLGVVVDGADHDEVPATARVRFGDGRGWGPWIHLVEDGAEGHDQWASALVGAGRASRYQIAGLGAVAGSARVVALNTSDGPRVQLGTVRGDVVGAEAAPTCRTRSQWGADESLRMPGGTPVWPSRYHPAQVVTVHHTATANGPRDPAAVVRAIYRYHAVDRGWGDIGYQYLVDETGVVYEGRWSGSSTRTCGSAADLARFGHEEGDADGDGIPGEAVVAAHTGGANSGNIGIAVLGDFTRVAPAERAQDAVVTLVATASERHDLDPRARVTYRNPANQRRHEVPVVSGHRDWKQTQCPGEQLYRLLPTIRSRAHARMSGQARSGPLVTVPSLPGL